MIMPGLMAHSPTAYASLRAKSKPEGRSHQSFVKRCFVSVEFFLRTIVCLPPHPFRLRRKFPFVKIEAAYPAQPRIDSRHAPMSPNDAVVELRGIGDLLPPPLPAGE